MEKTVIKSYEKFTGKHLCGSLFSNKSTRLFIKKETTT